MKRKIILLTTVALAIFAILFSQSPFFSVVAQKIALSDILKLDSTAPQSTGEVVKEHGNSLSITKEQAPKNDDVVEKAKKLIRKAEKDFLSEGWLHISSTTEIFSDVQNTFPDGSPIPTKWTDDLWVLLDDNGKAIKAVSVQDTGDSNTSQVSVFENGIWTNVTLGVVSSEPENYRPTLDSGFLNSTVEYKDITKLSTDTSIVDGQKAIIFVMEEKLKDPIELGKGGKDKKIYGSVYRFYFAENSGLPVLTEDYTINGDGSLEIAQRISIKVIEKVVMPPETILGYFTQ